MLYGSTHSFDFFKDEIEFESWKTHCERLECADSVHECDDDALEAGKKYSGSRGGEGSLRGSPGNTIH